MHYFIGYRISQPHPFFSFNIRYKSEMIHPLIQAVGHTARSRRRVHAAEPMVITSIKEEPVPKTLVRDAPPTSFPSAGSGMATYRSATCEDLVFRYLDQMQAEGSLPPPPPPRHAEPRWQRRASLPRGPRKEHAKPRKPEAIPTPRQPAHILACAQDSFKSPVRLVTG